MVEKNKIKEENIFKALDEIGCGCGCDDEPKKETAIPIKVSQPSALDSIGCGCGSCDDDVVDVKKNESGNKVFGFLKTNAQLAISFIVFFYAIFSSHTEIIKLGLYLTSYLLIARNVLYLAVKNVVKGKMLDENFLMSIASIVAFGIGEPAEGVAVMLFYRVGQLTEDYALTKSKKSISALLDIKPDYANLKTLTGTMTVDPSQVKIGDILVVKPGEKIPLDGIVINGESTINTAMITGESLPSRVELDSDVFSGTINIDAVIEIKVTQTFSNSTVSKILQLVEKANYNKSKTEKFITKFAKIYTPIVVVAAALVAIVPPLFFAQPLVTWLHRGAVFLVVSCPCALVISVPLGYFGGIGGTAKAGILVKGGNYLEVLNKVGTVVLDKTGTLTKGNFKLEEIKLLADYSESEVLKASAHLEFFSNHPIAKAIVSEYGETINESLIKNVKEVPGKGLSGLYDSKSILIGNEALLTENGIEVPKYDGTGTTLFLVVEKSLKAMLLINDEIKEGTKEALEQMKKMGVEKLVMLTGDREAIANKVGKELGIDEIHAELLPGEKLDILEELIEKSSKKVVFVGDGINDAPVLSRADAGIAMGMLGSDVAVESADIVLMTDEISKIPDAIKMSKFTSNIIWQNILIALGTKLIIMTLSIFMEVSMWVAVFGDVGVAFIAILNSGRAIYSYKKVISNK